MVVHSDSSSYANAFDFWVAEPVICSATGDDAFVRPRVLVSMAVSPALLVRRLHNSSDSEKSMAAGDLFSTSLAVHMKLACDEDSDVRYALAENHNISRDVLIKLRDDSNPYVSHRASKTLKRIGLNDTEFVCWQSCRSS